MIVAVIDSGISDKIKSDRIIDGICLKEENNQIVIEYSYRDEIGHGTAVSDILMRTSPHIKLFPIKIFEHSLNTSLNVLCAALEYIYNNIQCDFIQISAGINIVEDHTRLETIVNKLYEKNIIIVSAFDNEGAISYPAALNNVIGIDTSNRLKQDEFEIVENSIIDIIGTNSYFRVEWINPDRIIINGSSFTAAYILGLIANMMKNTKRKLNKMIIMDSLKKSAIRTHKATHQDNVEFDNKNFVRNINKAIAFPFNKEIHPLALFPSLLNFEMVGFYDTKYNKYINQRLNKVLPNCSGQYKINNYININWDSDFDTVICGHCNELSQIMQFDFLSYFIKKCTKHQKKLYTFDNIYPYIKNFKTKNLFCFPYVDNTFIPKNRFGKLRNSSKPIVGILGTSSKQGKYTLQLQLRKALKEMNYKVGQIGTEPSGYLFNLDFVFPMGYNSSVYINTYNSVSVLNEKIWEIEQNNIEITIVGSQSGSVTYDTNNLKSYLFSQYDFLLGTLPDAVILAINPDDSIEYINRTISFIESAIDTKVIALVLYPFKFNKNSMNSTRIRASDTELKQISDHIRIGCNLPVFTNVLDSENTKKLISQIISYFM